MTELNVVHDEHAQMTDHPTVPRSRRSSFAPSIRSVNFRQPTWKVKNAAPISAVSVVFAEPEQGTPLKSASGTLLSTTPAVTTPLEEDEAGGSLQPDSARQGIAATRSATTSPTRPIASSSNLTLNSKASLPNLPSRRAPRSPSLFTSLSRSKGKMAIRQLTADQAQQPLAPVVQTIDAPRVVHGDETPVASTSTSLPPDTSQSSPVVDVQPATPGQAIEPLIHQFPFVEGTDIGATEPKSVSPPSLNIQPSGKRSWYSSASSSPASSPPAPQYSPPKPPSPLHSIISNKDPYVQYVDQARTDSPPPISPPPQISATTSNRSLASMSSLPSSIDDRVPSLPSTPPVYLAANVPKSPPIPPSTNSLNPSSSRFTLSLPLLGRAKVPLERVKNSSRSSDSSSIIASTMNQQPASTIETPTPLESFVESPLSNLSRSVTPTPTQSLTDDASAVKSPPEHHPSIDPPQDDTVLPTTQPISPSASHDVSDTPTVRLPTNKASEQTLQPAKWWDYVGWTSSSTLTSPSAGAHAELPGDNERHDEVRQETPDSQTTTPVPPPESAGEDEAAPPSIPNDRSPAELASARVGTEPAEVTHVKETQTTVTDSSSTSTMDYQQRTTTNETTSAIWYVPWAWYSGSTTTETVENGEGVSEEVVVQETTVGENSASTIVEQPIVESPVEAEDKPSTPKLEEPEPTANSNPIADSFEANKLGWVSFFSSKMLTMKRIGYDPDALVEDVKRDENGMEVMDIDDEEDERGRAPDLKGLGGQPNEAALSVRPGVKPPPRDSSKASSRKKVAPPLTISDDIKKETEKANAHLVSNASTRNSRTNTPTPPSPTPSGTSTPSTDRKPGTTVTTTTSTTSKNGKVKTSVTTTKRVASPTPSKKSVAPAPPNLVLPTWQDTFLTPPRNVLPPQPEIYVDDQGVGGKLLGKTMKFVSGVLWNKESRTGGSTLKGKERAQMNEGSSLSTTASMLERERQERFREFGKGLPKAWSVFDDAGWDTRDTLSGRPSPPSGSGVTQPLNTASVHDVLKGCRRVVVIGVHGWFPGTMIRTVLGEPTGTSLKFASMMEQALNEFESEHGVKLDKITSIPLEGEGVIEKRVEKLYGNLLANEEWISDLHDADAILVATHSQGSVVSTHLLDRLIHDGHIVTSRSQSVPYGSGAETFPSAIGLAEPRKPQRLCCLALCGIHLGPLRYLSSSTLVGPYLQYFESTAARELFEFQNTESQVSKNYVKALQNVLDHGTKMLYVASLNDQVVPIYSGLFTAVSHPLILRALYIDGDAYNSSDFLSNLLVLLLRILNSGIPESGLLAHLSEATAGSLSGVGHSTAYEELATYSLAVKYLFLTDSDVTNDTKITVEPFNANHEQNDYEIPWALRDIIADERVAHFFSQEVAELRDAFRNWHPKTTILRDLKRKLQPITRLPSTMSSNSKL